MISRVLNYIFTPTGLVVTGLVLVVVQLLLWGLGFYIGLKIRLWITRKEHKILAEELEGVGICEQTQH